MATQIKITELGSIDNANLTYTTLFPGVNMVGTPLTQKVTLQQIGNVLLTGAGGAYYPPAAIANVAYSVANAAQPNITSLGNLTSLTVTGDVNIGGANALTKTNTGYNVNRNTQTTIDNIIARVSSDGKAQITVTSSSFLSYSGYEILSGLQASFTNSGIIVNGGIWLDITPNSLAAIGDIIVVTLQNMSSTNIYRISFIQTASMLNASVVIEKLI